MWMKSFLFRVAVYDIPCRSSSACAAYARKITNESRYKRALEENLNVYDDEKCALRRHSLLQTVINVSDDIVKLLI